MRTAAVEMAGQQQAATLIQPPVSNPVSRGVQSAGDAEVAQKIEQLEVKLAEISKATALGTAAASDVAALQRQVADMREPLSDATKFSDQIRLLDEGKNMDPGKGHSPLPLFSLG